MLPGRELCVKVESMVLDNAPSGDSPIPSSDEKASSALSGGCCKRGTVVEIERAPIDRHNGIAMGRNFCKAAMMQTGREAGGWMSWQGGCRGGGALVSLSVSPSLSRDGEYIFRSVAPKAGRSCIYRMTKQLRQLLAPKEA